MNKSLSSACSRLQRSFLRAVVWLVLHVVSAMKLVVRAMQTHPVMAWLQRNGGRTLGRTPPSPPLLQHPLTPPTQLLPCCVASNINYGQRWAVVSGEELFDLRPMGESLAPVFFVVVCVCVRTLCYCYYSHFRWHFSDMFPTFPLALSYFISSDPFWWYTSIKFTTSAVVASFFQNLLQTSI